MNLHACLGVGPGHVLLLGELTPGVQYRKPRFDTWAIPPGLVPGVKPRRRRSIEEAKLLRRRVLDALERGDSPTVIAKREDIDHSHVSGIALEHGVRRFRSRDQVDAIVAKAMRLALQFPSMKQKDIAAACGVTPSYLATNLSRRAAV